MNSLREDVITLKLSSIKVNPEDLSNQCNLSLLHAFRVTSAKRARLVTSAKPIDFFSREASGYEAGAIYGGSPYLRYFGTLEWKCVIKELQNDWEINTRRFALCGEKRREVREPCPSHVSWSQERSGERGGGGPGVPVTRSLSY